MYCLRLYLNENLEAELFSVSGSSFHAFVLCTEWTTSHIEDYFCNSEIHRHD